MDSHIIGAIIGASAAITAAAIAIVGVMIANNLRRQIKLATTETQLEAYAALWEILKVASLTRLRQPEPKPLTSQERKDLDDKITAWYYKDGNGMLLGEGTRNVFMQARKNLICPFEQIQPKSLQTEERRTDEGRGMLSMRQLSLLRTRMKADLEIYGLIFCGDLEPDDKAFLEQCGERLSRKPWRPKGIVVIDAQDD